VRNGDNPLKGWAALLFGAALAAAPALAQAQVSLATVVDLAQRNSSEVKLAERMCKKPPPRWRRPGRLHSQLRDRLNGRLLPWVPHWPAFRRQRHDAIAGFELFPATVHQSRQNRLDAANLSLKDAASR